MKKFSVGIFALMCTASLMAQTADDIISKVYEATGGRERWAKVTTIKRTGTLEFSPGVNAPILSFERVSPIIQYFSFSYQGMVYLQVMEGDSGWSYNPFGGKRETDPMSPDAIRERRISDPRGMFFDYKAKGCTMDYLGTDDIDGVDVYKLRMMTKDGDIVYFYIDQDTHYMLKSTVRMRFKDKEKVSSDIYSDFRKTDFGITVPYASQTVDEKDEPAGGAENYDKIEVNAKLDPALLKKPAGM